MPLVRAFDKNGKLIHNLSNFHEVIVSMEIENESAVVCCDDIKANSLDYSTLTRILRQTHTKLLEISIHGPATISAEYLTFFVSTCQKTDCLRLQDALHDAVEFGCLVSGMTQPGGLRELKFSITAPQQRDLKNHLLLLFRGIAFASSLERLHFVFLYQLDGICPAFIDAIRKNKSLKSLCIDLNWYADDGFLLPHVFQTAIQSNQIRELTLRISNARQPIILQKEVWMPSLCQQGCTIRKLCLSGIRLEMDSKEMSDQNTSVEELVIRNADLSSSDARSILSRFKCLVAVDLAFNNLKCGSIFDDLLFGNTLMLQSLNLEYNYIQEGELEMLIQTLPVVKNIRNLQLNGNPFVQSRTCVKAFENAVLSNGASLENVQYFQRGCDEKNNPKAPTGLGSDNTEDESYGDWQKIMVHLSLNRFGRQHLLGDTSHLLPSNLWPQVLERASKLRFYDMGDEWKRPSLECTRADVMYWLLREKVFV